MIKNVFLRSIRGDDQLKYLLASANQVQVSTIERWIREKAVILTASSNLTIIKNHFGLLESSELLEPEVVKD